MCIPICYEVVWFNFTLVYVVVWIQTQEEKAWFVTGVYDYFLIERDILQLTI